MREKLLKLMENEKLTASRLAELLGIRSSGISHILSERNKPSYDFLQKILRRFPNINPDWLLLDSDQMYRSGDVSAASAKNLANTSIIEANNELDFAGENFPFKTDYVTTPTQPSFVNSEAISGSAGELSQRVASRRGIKRIIVLYDDLTFESYDAK